MKNQNWILGIVLVAVLALVFFSGAGMMTFGGFGMMGSGMMGGYGGMMGGYGHQFGFNPLGALMMLAYWGLVIGGIVLVIVWLARNAGKATASGETPLNILKTRYARGEITKEQFDAMRQDLVA
jgi:putative membrane protein